MAAVLERWRKRREASVGVLGGVAKPSILESDEPFSDFSVVGEKTAS